MPTIQELDPQHTHLAYLAMLELRPHLTSRDQFVKHVNEDQRSEGYRLVGLFEENISEAVAAIGFRTSHSLAWGYYLYVDDLITRASFRGKGHGAALMQWVEEEARKLGCQQLHLDSGVQRFAAHRLYHSQHMRISSHHFQRDL